MEFQILKMKKFLYILVLFFFAIFVTTSCEKDVILDIPPGDPQLNIEGWIDIGEGPVVILSKTFSAYGTFNFFNLIDSLYDVRKAVVTVAETGGTPIQLAERSILDLPIPQAEEVARLFELSLNEAFILSFIPIYMDTTGTIIGQEFNSYDLTVSYEEHNLSATTTIPEFLPLDSLTYAYNDDIDTLATVYMHLTVPDAVNKYVRMATQRNDESFYYPDLGGSVYDNGLYAGNGSVRFPVERGYGRDEEPSIETYSLFVRGDSVTVEWRNIDRNTYNFWFTVENDGGDTPFSSPVTIATNINGGLGLWAGYAVSYESIYIPE